jgi:hypothetical protein
MIEAILAAEETKILVWGFVFALFVFTIGAIAGGSWTPDHQPRNPLDTDDFENGDN